MKYLSALAAAIMLAGCQSTTSTSTINTTQVVQNVQSDIQTSCAALKGLTPAASSIIAIINQAVPSFVVSGDAATTGLNIANAICAAYTAVASKPSLAKTMPIMVRGVVVTFQAAP